MQRSAKETRPGGAVAALFAQGRGKEEAVADEDLEVAPILPPQAQEPGAPLLDAMKRTRQDPERFEEYVRSRPVEPSPQDEAFKNVPVEAFGRAMLAGMGFKEGDNEREVKPYLLDGRPALLGLGAKPKPQDAGVLARGKNKRVYTTIGSLGQIEGTHRFAIVSQSDGVPGLDMIRVRTLGISTRGENENELVEIDVPRKAFIVIPDISSLSMDHPARRVFELNEKKNIEDAKRAEEALAFKRQKIQENDRYWVREGLRVLIVDENDEYNYKKKGVIVRVEDGRSDVRLDKDPSIILKRMKEKYLQTVVPDEKGVKIIVVLGEKHRGLIGELIERDKRKDRAWIKFPNGIEDKFSLDDVCEIVKD